MKSQDLLILVQPGIHGDGYDSLIFFMAYITYLRKLLSYSYFEIIYILRHKQVSEKDMILFFRMICPRNAFYFIVASCVTRKKATKG